MQFFPYREDGETRALYLDTPNHTMYPQEQKVLPAHTNSQIITDSQCSHPHWHQRVGERQECLGKARATQTAQLHCTFGAMWSHSTARIDLNPS